MGNSTKLFANEKQFILTLKMFVPVIFALAFLMTSCTPTELEAPQLPNEKPAASADFSKASDSQYRIIFCIESWYGPPINIRRFECHCSSTGGNCLPDVIVTNSTASAMDNFIDAVDADKVPDFFEVEGNYKDLFKEVPEFETYLPGLRDGTLNFTLLNDIVGRVTYSALHDARKIITSANVSSEAIIVIPFAL